MIKLLKMLIKEENGTIIVYDNIRLIKVTNTTIRNIDNNNIYIYGIDF